MCKSQAYMAISWDKRIPIPEALYREIDNDKVVSMMFRLEAWNIPLMILQKRQAALEDIRGGYPQYMAL